MLKIYKKDITELYKLDVLHDIHVLREKIEYFKKEYKCNFLEFETKVKSSKKEVFSEWDDYIEWKAYINTLNTRQNEIKEIDNENFQLVG